MRRVWVVATLTLVLLAAPLAAVAQAGKVYRIGYLSQRSRPSALEEAFREGLRDLGYIEGTNITVEYRWAGSSQDRYLAALASDLVRLKVDLIVAAGAQAALAVEKVTLTTPIVFAAGDPVGLGLVRSLARPGGNATGVSLFTYGLTAKRLALLKETLPGVERVAVLSNPADPFSDRQLKDTKDAAAALRLRLHVLNIRDSNGFDQAFAVLKRDRAEALLVSADPMFFNEREKVVSLVTRDRVPAIYEFREFVALGGLMSYGTSIGDMYRRLASYVEKVLKGAKPGDLPVEQPTKFDLVVNLKTAKALGLTIPPSVLARADEVIE
jgi:putative tryptophan/tyrosine transport system substrate-binding protein